MTKLSTDRRGFLKTGLFGSALLTSGSFVAGLSGCSKQPATIAGYKILRSQDIEFLSAVIPVVAGDKFPGALKEQALARTLKQLDIVINGLNGHAYGELTKLFDAMAYAPVRVVAGAPWSDWSDSSPEQINDFLNSWRTSFIPLKRMGYISICKLINISWYSQPENFSISNYPGPPIKVPYSDTEID